MKYFVRNVTAAIIVLFVLQSCSSRFAKSPEMVYVEGGTFTMGSIFSGGDEDEKPAYEVKLGSYYIGRYEVTLGEFAEFVEATGYVTTAEKDGGADIFNGVQMVPDSCACWNHVNFKQGATHPVVCVSWHDAVKYCNWRSERDGLQPCNRGKAKPGFRFLHGGFRLVQSVSSHLAS